MLQTCIHIIEDCFALSAIIKLGIWYFKEHAIGFYIRYVWRRAFCHSLKYIFQIQEFCGEECFVWIWEFTCGDISQVYICMLVYVRMHVQRRILYVFIYTHNAILLVGRYVCHLSVIFRIVHAMILSLN